MKPTYEELQIENAKLKACIQKLEERIAALEARLNQNSKNSSKPPSSDQKRNKEPAKDKEKKAHHTGASRKLLPESEVTSREIRAIENCPHCLSSMNPTGEVFSWQQIELPVIKPLVHQIDLVTSKCPCCNHEVRPDLKEAEQFLLGPRLEGLVNLLMGQYRQGHRPVRMIISTILPGVFLSQGLISKIKARAAKTLWAPYEELLAKITLGKDPIHVDATGWRHLGKGEHALVLRIGNIVSYAIVSHQKGETLANLLGKRVHCLISDRGLATSQIVIKVKQYCLAHLIRNICGQAEHPGVSCEDTQALGWIHDRLQELFVDKHRFEKGEISKNTWKQYGYAKWITIEEELEKLVVNGSTKKLRKFCTKLLSQIKHFRAYLKDEAIPMTNNPAEEALRNLVIARKLCFGSKSLYGKKWRESLHSCLETLHRQGKSLLDFLAEAILATRTGKPIPSVI